MENIMQSLVNWYAGSIIEMIEHDIKDVEAMKLQLQQQIEAVEEFTALLKGE